MQTIYDHSAQLLLFGVNLMFILTHLYGWILKWFYRPKAYENDFDRLFPAARSVGLIYLLQILEVPYLLQVGCSDALLYVNAFSVLFFSLQMLIMCDRYFFSKAKSKLINYMMYLPTVIILLPLFLQAIHLIALPDGYRHWAFIAVTAVLLVYFALSVRMALRLGRTVRLVNEAAYADSADFPTRLAMSLQWMPSLVCVIMAVNFYADNAVVKAIRDVMFTFVGIRFCIFTLNPRRKVFNEQEEEIIEQIEQSANSSFRLGDERYEELRLKLDKLLLQEHIYTEPHITIDTLMQRMCTNANYISEVIRRSGYQSFYDMINSYRVRHAISLIQKNPDEKLLIIAEQCGFASSSSMSKAFKQQGKPSPSSFKKKG